MPMRHLRWLIADERGLATVEYAVLLSAIIVGFAVTWESLRASMVNIGEEAQKVLAPNTASGVDCQ